MNLLMLIGDFWLILGQRNLVYCQGFRREKILKSDPLNPAKGSGELCDFMTLTDYHNYSESNENQLFDYVIMC